MTQSGDPKDNAVAERINGILKTEFLNHHHFAGIRQVRNTVSQAIEFYNNKRPHRSLDMMTPVQARQMTGQIKNVGKVIKTVIGRNVSSKICYLCSTGKRSSPGSTGQEKA